MRRKQRIKSFKKILYIEDGSVDLNRIDDLCDANPEIFVIVYRQGAMQPELVDIKNGVKRYEREFI